MPALNTPLLLTVVAVAATMMVVYGLHRLLDGDGDVSRRLGDYLGPARREAYGAPAAAKEKRAQPRVARSFSASIAQDLARADLRLTVSEYLFLHVIASVVCFTAAFVFTRQAATALPFAVVGLFLPRIFVTSRQHQRLTAFNSQLADTMMLVANSMRSGYSLLQSFEVVSRESPSPTNEEFSRVVREVSLGLSPEEALSNLVRRLNSEDLSLMVTAINVQHEVGGNLARILDSISGTIRERVKVKGEIRTLTAQQRVASYVVTGMPVATGVILYLINPDYMLKLFSMQKVVCMPIIALPIIAGLMIVAGYVVIQKVVAIEV